MFSVSSYVTSNGSREVILTSSNSSRYSKQLTACSSVMPRLFARSSTVNEPETPHRYRPYIYTFTASGSRTGIYLVMNLFSMPVKDFAFSSGDREMKAILQNSVLSLDLFARKEYN